MNEQTPGVREAADTARERLTAWLNDDGQPRYHLPYKNPTELKADIRVVVAAAERADEYGKRIDEWRSGEEYRRLYARAVAAEAKAAAMEAALTKIVDPYGNEYELRNIARAALAAGAADSTEELPGIGKFLDAVGGTEESGGV